MQNQKFLAFWGWQSLPWNEPIDLKHLFWQERTEAVASRLLFSLASAAHVFVITAPAGHGKSTFAHWLYHQLDPKTHDVALFSLMQTQNQWLFPRLAHYLGLEQSDPRTVIQHLHKALVRGKILTIIIDEAHKLNQAEAFDELLSLLQAPSSLAKSINFVLIGNPRLLKTFPAIESLQHRLSLCTDLRPLNAQELASYLGHRLQQLKLPTKTIEPEAMALAAQNGIGTFANVESLLEISLVEAFRKDQRSISSDVMTAAIQFLGLQKTAEESTSQNGSKARALAQRRLKATSATQAALDLNSLYYKSGGSHDPEQS